MSYVGLCRIYGCDLPSTGNLRQAIPILVGAEICHWMILRWVGRLTASSCRINLWTIGENCAFDRLCRVVQSSYLAIAEPIKKRAEVSMGVWCARGGRGPFIRRALLRGCRVVDLVERAAQAVVTEIVWSFRRSDSRLDWGEVVEDIDRRNPLFESSQAATDELCVQRNPALSDKAAVAG